MVYITLPGFVLIGARLDAWCPNWCPLQPPGELPPLATLQIFDNSKKNKNVPSTYGKAYAPLKVP